VLPRRIVPAKAAEIIPVEPEQGNACAGKVETFYNFRFIICRQASPVLNAIIQSFKTKEMKKKLNCLLALLLLAATAWAQNTMPLSGTVIDKSSGQPIAGATVEVGAQRIIAGEDGRFRLTIPGEKPATLTVSNVGYRSFQGKISGGVIVIELERIPLFLQPVEVKAVRAGERAPFTKTNLSKKDIEKQNLGQDLPFLLDQTPSVVVNSDAGNGIGYTGIRIRGSDATRINVTLNGIPYNDAESQGLFMVNLPDFASSVSSIQVQRGVGTSSNGTGAFGATINIGTNEFNEKRYAELNNSFGSFNSRKHTLKFGTGLLGKHFTLDTRFSHISSDGFIDRASSRLEAAHVSAAWLNAGSMLRFNFFTGKEKTYQAWYGVPEALLKTNRSFNAAGTEKAGEPYENEADNYRQDHYQFFYNQQLGKQLNMNMAIYLTRGKGYYEQYKAAASFSNYNLPDAEINNTVITEGDLVRQLWLDNYLYGGIFSLQYKNAVHQLTLGGGWNRYDGKHYGDVIWAQYQPVGKTRWYDLDAMKQDRNLYAKWQMKLGARVEGFADLQWRNVQYNINGFRNNPALVVRNNYHFVNPKAGISYRNRDWTAYVSYALANKEPNRDDFEAAETEQPKPETLHDVEAGAEWRRGVTAVSATLYYMYYRNQLVLTGRINDVGAYTRTNIDKSYRTGVELQVKTSPLRWMNVAAHLSLSRNKVARLSQFADDYDNGGQVKDDYRNTDLALSPRVVAGATLNLIPVRGLELSLLSKYTGRQYLDNAQQESRSLRAYDVHHLRAAYELKPGKLGEIKLMIQVNNALNRHYEPNGYTFGYISGGQRVDENYYFPMAGRNWLAGVNLRF
jgi:iron complex outermembrane recepter protein